MSIPMELPTLRLRLQYICCQEEDDCWFRESCSQKSGNSCCAIVEGPFLTIVETPGSHFHFVWVEYIWKL